MPSTDNPGSSQPKTNSTQKRGSSATNAIAVDSDDDDFEIPAGTSLVPPLTMKTRSKTKKAMPPSISSTEPTTDPKPAAETVTSFANVQNLGMNPPQRSSTHHGDVPREKRHLYDRNKRPVMPGSLQVSDEPKFAPLKKFFQPPTPAVSFKPSYASTQLAAKIPVGPLGSITSTSARSAAKSNRKGSSSHLNSTYNTPIPLPVRTDTSSTAPEPRASATPAAQVKLRKLAPRLDWLKLREDSLRSTHADMFDENELLSSLGKASATRATSVQDQILVLTEKLVETMQDKRTSQAAERPLNQRPAQATQIDNRTNDNTSLSGSNGRGRKISRSSLQPRRSNERSSQSRQEVAKTRHSESSLLKMDHSKNDRAKTTLEQSLSQASHGGTPLPVRQDWLGRSTTHTIHAIKPQVESKVIQNLSVSIPLHAQIGCAPIDSTSLPLTTVIPARSQVRVPPVYRKVENTQKADIISLPSDGSGNSHETSKEGLSEARTHRVVSSLSEGTTVADELRDDLLKAVSDFTGIKGSAREMKDILNQSLVFQRPAVDEIRRHLHALKVEQTRPMRAVNPAKAKIYLKASREAKKQLNDPKPDPTWYSWKVRCEKIEDEVALLRTHVAIQDDVISDLKASQAKGKETASTDATLTDSGYASNSPFGPVLEAQSLMHPDLIGALRRRRHSPVQLSVATRTIDRNKWRSAPIGGLVDPDPEAVMSPDSSEPPTLRKRKSVGSRPSSSGEDQRRSKRLKTKPTKRYTYDAGLWDPESEDEIPGPSKGVRRAEE